MIVREARAAQPAAAADRPDTSAAADSAQALPGERRLIATTTQREAGSSLKVW